MFQYLHFSVLRKERVKIIMEYKYDIAISYKSEMEEKAAKIADFLMADGWKVFFAPEEQ